MKNKILLSLILIVNIYAEDIISSTPPPQGNQGESIFLSKDKNVDSFIDNNINVNNQSQKNENSYANPQYQVQAFNEFQQKGGELSEEQLALMKSAIRNQNLKALQSKFFSKKYTGYENTQKIKYQENKTIKLRTRFAMATTLIFETDIINYILGDTSGFQIEEIPNLPNAIAIKPMLIGVDTSLTIFTKDNKLHTFYLFSTDYKNQHNPALVVYIEDENTKKDLLALKEKEEKEYLIIEQGIAKMKVKKSEIDRNYIQTAKKQNEWLKADEIFSDKKFTYFKYDKDKMPQIPTIFAVIDRQDSPVETRIIGNYIIAETIAEKFSIKSGDSYVCVKRVKAKK